MRASKFILSGTLIFLLFLIGAYGFRSRRGIPGNEIQRPRNIYIITASGLRQDHISSYMYQHGQTPALDFLAYDGIRFLNAYSSSSEALPAHLSLLTGQYPFSKRQPVFLPEWFSKKGYKTAAILADGELREQALCEKFQEAFSGDSLLQPWMQAFSPAEVSRLALDWSLKNSGHPQFLLINFGEPTAPFQPPRPYNEQYANHPYDGEIAALDEQIGSLIHGLKDSGLFQNSIVVFAAPYGESLDDEIRSGNLRPSILKIPLFIAAPGLLPVHQEYNKAVSLTDVFPTLLRLLDQQSGESFDGVPLFKKGASEEIGRNFVFAETQFPVLFGQSPQFFITDGGKYYASAEQDGDLDLRKILENEVGSIHPLQDPEKTSAAASLLEEVDVLAQTGRYKKALSRLADLQPHDATSSYTTVLKARLLTAMKDFGQARTLYEKAYERSQNPRLLSERSAMELEAGQFQTALQLQHAYRKTGAPLSYFEHNTIGIALFHKGDLAAAQQELNAALKRNPRLADAFLYRGLTFEKQNRTVEAEADLKRAFELNPGNPETTMELGRFLQNQKHPAAAIACFTAFLQHDPKNYLAMLKLAQLQEETGNRKAARRLSEQVLLYSDDPALRKTAREIIAR